MQYIGQYSNYVLREVLEQYPSYQISNVKDCQSQKFFRLIELQEEMTLNKCLEMANLTMKHFYLLPILDYGNTNRTFFVYPQCLSLRNIIDKNYLSDPQLVFNIIRQIFLSIIQIGQEVRFFISLNTIYVENIENNGLINVKIMNSLHEPNFYTNLPANQNEHITALSKLWQNVINRNSLLISREQQTLIQMMVQQNTSQHQISNYLSQFKLHIVRPNISDQFKQLFEVYEKANNVEQSDSQQFIRNAKMKHHSAITFIQDFLNKLQLFQQTCRMALGRRQLLGEMNSEWTLIQEQNLEIETKKQEYQRYEGQFTSDITYLRSQFEICRQLVELNESFTIDSQKSTIKEMMVQLDEYANANQISENDELNLSKLTEQVQQIPKITFLQKFQNSKLQALNQIEQKNLEFKQQIEKFKEDNKEKFYESEKQNAENQIQALLSDLDTRYQDSSQQVNNIESTTTLKDKYIKIDKNVVSLFQNDLQNIISAFKTEKEAFESFKNSLTFEEIKLKLARNPQTYQSNRNELLRQIKDQQLVEQLAIIIDKKENNFEQNFKDHLFEALRLK